MPIQVIPASLGNIFLKNVSESGILEIRTLYLNVLCLEGKEREKQYNSESKKKKNCEVSNMIQTLNLILHLNETANNMYNLIPDSLGLIIVLPLSICMILGICASVFFNY